MPSLSLTPLICDSVRKDVTEKMLIAMLSRDAFQRIFLLITVAHTHNKTVVLVCQANYLVQMVPGRDEFGDHLGKTTPRNFGP